MPRQRVSVAVLAGCLIAGCGGERDVAPPPDPAATRAAAPAWARTPARTGEVVVRGDASPRSHGSFSFRGRYTVRFAQFAPENPALDLSGETSFVAALHRRAATPGAGTIRLFRAAKAQGTRRVTLRGRFFVDVEFGDFPYVIRFTPAR